MNRKLKAGLIAAGALWFVMAAIAIGTRDNEPEPEPESRLQQILQAKREGRDVPFVKVEGAAPATPSTPATLDRLRLREILSELVSMFEELERISNMPRDIQRWSEFTRRFRPWIKSMRAELGQEGDDVAVRLRIAAASLDQMHFCSPAGASEDRPAYDELRRDLLENTSEAEELLKQAGK